MPIDPPPIPIRRPNHSLALDGWRAIACLLVLFYHTGFSLQYGPFTVWGFTGVHLFFVLSGYLLFRPFGKVMRIDAPFGFGRFYLRRLLRIYPAYLLALAVFTAAHFAAKLHPPSMHELLMHLLLAFNSADPREFFGINVAFWTLAIEAQFYVLLPVLAFAVYRLLGRRSTSSMFATAVLFLCLGLAARGWELLHTTGTGFTNDPVIRYHTVFSFLDFFAGGMFIAALEAAGLPSEVLGRRATWGLLAGGVGLFLLANGWCTSVAGDWMLVNDFFFLWGFPPLLIAGLTAILFVVLRANGFLTALLASRPMVYIGKISYSVYLFHILVQIPIFKLLPLEGVRDYGLRTFLWGCVSLVPTLLLSAVVYRFVEQPFLNMAARLKS